MDLGSMSRRSRERSLVGSGNLRSRNEVHQARFFMVGVWNPNNRYWVVALVRAAEWGLIENVLTARTLGRLESGDLEFAHALCHGTSREHLLSILKHGLQPQGRPRCKFFEFPIWDRKIGDGQRGGH